MNQNMPIFPIYKEIIAKYIDIQNIYHLFYSTCANELLKMYILAKYLQNIPPSRDDVARAMSKW